MLNLIAYLPIASKGVRLRKIDIYKLLLILVFLKNYGITNAKCLEKRLFPSVH